MTNAAAGASRRPLDPALVGALLSEGAVDDQAPGRAIPQVPLAEHRNHTPVPSQYFQTVDAQGEVFHVVVLRVTHDMRRLQPDGTMALADDQTPLVTEDHWSGAPNESCPLWESDFAPYKPRCDVLVVNAMSRPPAGALSNALGRLAGSAVPWARSRRWACGVGLQWTDGLGATRQWVKHLAVTGPRHYVRSGLSEPQPSDGVAIGWQNACGGQLKLPATDQHAGDGTLLRAAGADRWDTDERNPIGRGLRCAAGEPAPQLEVSMEQPYDGGPIDRYPPVSLTPLARSWLPRRTLAGTYDDDWLRTQWPLSPLDFDQGYWNCAPADQQIDYPSPGARLTLLNLYPPNGLGGLAMDAGVWRGRLPLHQPFLLWRLHPGPMIDRPLNLDTLVVDLATQRVCATYRGVLSARAQVRVVETRLAQHMTQVPTPAPVSAQALD